MTEKAKPFSIRHFVYGLRQKDNIAHNWPFREKYLKLCLDKGYTHILPPIGARGACLPAGHSSNDEKLATKETENNIICTETSGIDSNSRQNSAEVFEVEAPLDHVCRQMNQLCITSMDEQEQDGGGVGHPPLTCSSREESCSRTKALQNHHMSMKKNSRINTLEVLKTDNVKQMKNSKISTSRISKTDNAKQMKNSMISTSRISKTDNAKQMKNSKNDGFRCGGRKKAAGRTKKKSLTEIFAVAKHCVLDGFDKVLYVSSGDSFAPCSEGDYLSEEKEESEVVAGASSNNNHKNFAYKFTEDSLSKKKKKKKMHQRCKDYTAADDMYEKPMKKSRLGTVVRASTLPKDNLNVYNLHQGKLMSRSCKSSQKPKGYRKTNSEIYGHVPIRELQDHRAYTLQGLEAWPEHAASERNAISPSWRRERK